MENKRNSFSTSFGFVLASAASAVGLGNIWRFPYLAAKDGGGVFLLVYIILALTFGFTLLISEVAIGRKTRQSAYTAYAALNKRAGWVGVLASAVPFIILPYYALIGGWVLKYFTAFVTGDALASAEDGYFSGFITAHISPIVFDVVFLAATAFVVYKGVEQGIERLSRILMPVLLFLVIGISIFSLTIEGEGGRTGLEGFAVYVIPNFSGMSFKTFFYIVVDAMGQLFYSISVAMGIMVTYGSYFKSESNLVKSVNQIEIFDTLVAFLAGIMIIPAVYAFLGMEGMQNSGPGLMFIALPKVFAKMGSIGVIVGAVFFLMVLFAALTSSVSVMEAVVSGCIDRFGWSRHKAVALEGCLALVLGVIVCLGYNVFYFEATLPNGVTAQILDIFDYISNYILMPVVAIGTCILVGWVIKPQTIIAEITRNGEHFARKNLYIVMVKYIAPILLTILLLGAFGVF